MTLQNASMPDYMKTLSLFGHELGASLVIVICALLLSRVLRRLIVTLRVSGHLAPVMAGRLQTFRRWTILILTMLLLMQVLGVFGSAWALISASIAALALGFVAAWSMLSNATAALLILTFRPFRIGDTVELLEPNGSGVGGRVVDMTLMYTTLSVVMTAEELQEQTSQEPPQYLHIPNNLFFQKILRTRSSYARGSKATFFSKPDA
jgi:small-conductance mechanosensitive channel